MISPKRRQVGNKHADLCENTGAPFYWHGLIIFTPWISNYTHYGIWDKKVCPVWIFGIQIRVKYDCGWSYFIYTKANVLLMQYFVSFNLLWICFLVQISVDWPEYCEAVLHLLFFVGIRFCSLLRVNNWSFCYLCEIGRIHTHYLVVDSIAIRITTIS